MSNHEFDGRPFVAGSITGVRSFQIDKLGRLTGVSYARVFRPGENVANCIGGGDLATTATLTSQAINRMLMRVSHSTTVSFGGVSTRIEPEPEAAEAKHRVGQVGCSCGYWAYFDRGNNPHHRQGQVVGLIEGYGTVTVGSRGFRAEKARLVALVAPSRRTLSVNAWAGRIDPDRWYAPAGFIGGVACGGVGTATTIAMSISVSLWALSLALPSVIALVTGYACFRSIDVHEPIEPPHLSAVRRNYPDVPVYRSLRAALRAHPLTPPPEAEPLSPETCDDFWTRSAA